MILWLFSQTIHQTVKHVYHFGLLHVKTYPRAYEYSEGLDQPSHPQSDQGFHSPLTESLDTTECLNGEQRIGLSQSAHFAHVTL